MCDFLIYQLQNHLHDWVLVLTTIVLAYFTWLLYAESEKSRIQSITPQISLIIFPEHGQVLFLRVKNTSKNDACNVKLVCNTDFIYDETVKSYNYRESLSHTYEYMAVNQSFDYLLGRYEKIKNVKLEFRLSFWDVNNKYEFKYPIKIDLSQYNGSWLAMGEMDSQKYVKDIALNLADIKQALKNMFR